MTTANTYPGTIIVTGASGGVGYHIAQRLLESDVKDLALLYRRDGSKLEELCQKHGVNSKEVLYQGDLTHESEVEFLMHEVDKNTPKLWALLNVAGESSNGVFWKLASDAFRDVIEANLLSTFLMSKAVSATMRSQGYGRIVNFSSVVAQNGVVGAAHYASSKAAIEGFTRASAAELANKGVLVNAVGLGYFEYGMIRDVPEPMLASIIQSIPLGRLGTIDDLFPVISCLIDPAQAYITGQVLHISGGLRF